MKKILVVNLHSTRNAGDHALLQLSLKEIYSHIPDAAVILSANDPESFAAAHNREEVVSSFLYWYGHNKTKTGQRKVVQLVQMGKLIICSLLIALYYRLTGKPSYIGIQAAQHPLLRAYFEADLVLSCPGNFIYSRAYMAGIPILMPLFTIVYAWLIGKPIFMLPQTVGPLWRGWERQLLKWVLRKMQVILVRDLTSVALLQAMGFEKDEYHLVPDLAFQFASAGETEGERLLRSYGIDRRQQRPLLGVTLIDWGAQNPAFDTQDEYEWSVAQTIQTFVEEQDGYSVLFSQVCGPKRADDDRIPARRVRKLLDATPVAHRVVMIDEEVPPAVLKAAYGQMDLFLGSRLHSNIFALGEGTPVIAIAYQDKTPGVMRMLELGEWVIDIEDVNVERLVALYRNIWLCRAELHVQILESVRCLSKKTQSTLDCVYEDIVRTLAR